MPNVFRRRSSLLLILLFPLLFTQVWVIHNVLTGVSGTSRNVAWETLTENATDAKSSSSTLTLDQNHYNDTNFYEYPTPRLTNSHVVIFVLSRRDSFEVRQVIRETWASGYDNVYFVLGMECSAPPSQGRCEERDVKQDIIKTASANNDQEFLNKLPEIQSKIRQEMHQYRDIILSSNFIDSYCNLPAKLKTAYHWGVRHLPQALWFIKADDDMYLRVHRLMNTTPTRMSGLRGGADSLYFHDHDRNNGGRLVPQEVIPADGLDPLHHAIITAGHLMVNLTVQRQGKWAELDDFKNERYPLIPLGSGGHMVSRFLGQYIVNHSDALVNYQGEDTSLGIWAKEAPFPVWYFHDIRMSWSSRHLADMSMGLVGHQVHPRRMHSRYAEDQSLLANGTN